MATLSIIAEPLPDWEARVHLAAAADLTNALADTAPRSCSVRFLTARGSAPPRFASPRIAVEQLPLRPNALPLLWQSNAAARPLDGEMAHAVTPLIPLRPRVEDDGTQSSVTVPHALAWGAPELLSPAHLRLTRAYVKRAARYADVIITTSHTTATLLQEHYGANIPVQVIPPVAPTVFLAGPDAGARRSALGLPDRYLVTTANDDHFGRLNWALNALRSDPSLPHLVVLAGLDPVVYTKGATQQGDLSSRIPAELKTRVTVVPVTELRDAGAVLSGAAMLVQPQSFTPTGYETIAALMSAVPVLHAGTDTLTEYVLDAGIAEADEHNFITTLSRLFIANSGDGTSELERLTVQASDRSRSFSWQATAWQLWETHASI